MKLPGTITRIIRDLESTEQLRRDAAVRELWERFFADLTAYARKRLKAMNASRGPADEEDAASRAFMKVCRGIERGQLKLANRVDLTKVAAVGHRARGVHAAQPVKGIGRAAHRRHRPGPGRRPGPSARPPPPGLRRLPASARPARDRRCPTRRHLEAGRSHQRGDRGQARLLGSHGRGHLVPHPRDLEAVMGRRGAPRAGEARTSTRLGAGESRRVPGSGRR